MENSDIYIFDESSPLLESQRNVLFHGNRADTTLTPTYLIELPEYEPNAPVPPTALLEKRRRSRGASIINPHLQHGLTDQEMEEPLQYFMATNLTNYRKSILVKDSGETHGIITAETRDNEMGFEVVEPSQGLNIEKGSSHYTYSVNNKAKQKSNIGFATAQRNPYEEKLTITNNNNIKNEVQSLNNRSEDNQSLNCLLKQETRRQVSDNVFVKVAHQSPFKNAILDSTTSVPLQISLMLIASDDSVGCENNRDNQLKNEYNNRNDSPKQNGHNIASFADQICGNEHYSDRTHKQLNHQTRPAMKSYVGGKEHSNYPQNISQGHKMQQHQSSYPAKLSQVVLIEVGIYIEEDNNTRDKPSERQNQIERKVEGLPRRPKDNSKHSIIDVIDKPHKSAKKVFCMKRYHVQLLKQDKQDKSFNMCFAIENCDMDLKYEGPVKITKYYSTNENK